MLVLGLGVQKFRIHLQGAVKVKGADIDEVRRVDQTVFRVVDGGGFVDGFDFACYTLNFFLGDEVNLVEHDAVGKSQLFYSLIFNALWLFLVNVLNDVFGIHDGDDAVEFVPLSHLIVNKERLRHGCRVGQPGGFDENAVKVLDPVVHTVENIG